MDWVKKNWVVLVCGLVALLGIGVGVWAMMGFTAVQAEANRIAGIAGTLEGLRKGAANIAAIEEARKYYDEANKDIFKARDQAKETNKRTPLRDDVFPKALTRQAPYNFRSDYQLAMRNLPQDLKAERAPTGTTVDLIVSRLEDKHRKQANVTTAGGELSVPKPPAVRKIEPVLPTVLTAAGSDRGLGRGEDPTRGGGRGEDPNRGGGRGEDPNRGGGSGYGPRPFSPAAPTAILPVQPQVKIPSREQLMPEATRIATYETAKRIWTYIDDGSLQMHAIGYPDFQGEPTDIEMWSAQVFYWIEKDIVDALRRVNEQAAATLPDDQKWVAHLPVKHLVSLNISEYLAGGATDETGRATSLAVLHRQSGSAGMTMRGSASGRSVSTAFGNAAVAFTGRARNDQYDVVHVALNIVVDARDLPKVLVELCKQNFITPLSVQYQNVDVMSARQAGYLYGSGPVVSADIVCEVLFFRSIFDDKMPQKVKDILSGTLVEDPSGRMGR